MNDEAIDEALRQRQIRLEAVADAAKDWQRLRVGNRAKRAEGQLSEAVDRLRRADKKCFSVMAEARRREAESKVGEAT